jgi:hypothetical protein
VPTGSWRVGLELGAAREHVRVARALSSLPLISDALRLGQLSYSKARALTRVATPETEALLLGMAHDATASQLERICRHFRSALRVAIGERPEDEEHLRWVRERETASGLVRFDIQVTVDEAAVVRRALEAATSREWKKDRVSAGTRPASLRRADAFVAMAERFLTANSTDGAPPVEVVVHVEGDADAGGTLDDGTPLHPSTTARLTCDAAVVEVVEDSRGNVLDVGRRRRTIPTRLRRALRLRDRGCRFPGCTNRHVDGHHVVPWSRGGSTSLENLCSLCRRHHVYVHEYGIRIVGEPSGDLRFFRPDGREMTAPIPGTVGESALRSRLKEEGIAIDAQTNAPRWDGRAADYDHIIWTLMGAALKPASSMSQSQAVDPPGQEAFVDQ